MSLESVNIMRQQRENQMRFSPSSEEFQIIGGTKFFGIFDRANFTENKDKGNVNQKFLRPVIQVSTVPGGLTERQSKIAREEGKEYTFFRSAVDDEGVTLLWLS